VRFIHEHIDEHIHEYIDEHTKLIRPQTSR
jgi:hypothetical protein